MKKKVLITGASGFVGGHLVEEAIRRGYSVNVVVRKSSDISYLKAFDVNYYYFNILDEEAFTDHLNAFRYEYVIHNAGVTQTKKERTYYKVNTTSVEVICNAINCLSHQPKLIFISSLAAYGPAEFTPNGVISNNHDPHPVTHYGKSKLKGEQYLHDNADFDYEIIRPTAVYGPREKDLFTMFKMVDFGISFKIGKEPQKLTFIYVKDLVRAIMDVAQSELVYKKGYFIADAYYYSNQQFNDLLKKHLNRRTLNITLPSRYVQPIGRFLDKFYSQISTLPPISEDKSHEITAKSWVCDTQTIEDKIGFTSTTSLDQGIMETVEWYKTHKWL